MAEELQLTGTQLKAPGWSLFPVLRVASKGELWGTAEVMRLKRATV